ncbi:MAG: beta-N-acetylhexosaminidase [Pseudomonadota bacterium]
MTPAWENDGPEGQAPSALIVGLAGPALLPSERAFLREAEPWGLILFARNVETPAQVAALTAEARAAVGRDLPVLIDQEGGRVARMEPPHWRAWPPVLETVGALGAAEAAEALRLRFRLIAHELRQCGVDVNCMPLLDVLQPQTHAVIGARALGREPEAVARFGRVIHDALLAGGVLPVIKHLPGHGRAALDTHLALPRVAAPLPELEAVDFAAFRPLADAALGMTAHIVYEALDPALPATLSPAGIAAIRERIGFDGLLMTDDLSMQALSGPIAARAEAALAAGCDVILHCNGEMAEMEAIAAVTPRLSGLAAARAFRALAARAAPAPFDADGALGQYLALAG